MPSIEVLHQSLELAKTIKEKPDLWVEGFLDCRLWAMQREIVKSVFKFARTTVRSCTGSGKSFMAARVVLAFLNAYRPSIVLTTAPTFRQVEAILWREIAAAYVKAKFPLGGNLKATRLDMAEDWFAIGMSTDEPERFQGFHSRHILVVGDEASGLPEPIYMAIETPLSTGHARELLIGNPTQQIGRFRDTFDGEESKLYQRFHISAFDTPNFAAFNITPEDIKTGAWKEKIGVAQYEIESGKWLAKLPYPQLVTPLWVAQRYEAWGEGSFAYQVYVLGNFPKKGINNLFVPEEVEAAVNREKVMDEGEKVSAADIARYGDCKSVFGTRRGERVIKIEEWGHEGIHYTTGRLKRHYLEDETSVLHIDAGGIGVDDCDVLEKEGVRVHRVNSNEPAIDKERFGNRRAELFFYLSKRFADGKISIPDDRELVSQLCDIRIREYTGRGGMLIESKENMRARGSVSPDKADFLAMLFYPEEVGGDETPPVWSADDWD